MLFGIMMILGGLIDFGRNPGASIVFILIGILLILSTIYNTSQSNQNSNASRKINGEIPKKTTKTANNKRFISTDYKSELSQPSCSETLEDILSSANEQYSETSGIKDRKNNNGSTGKTNTSFETSRNYGTSNAIKRQYRSNSNYNVYSEPNSDYYLSDESVLKIHGYSVSKKDGLSSKERQAILSDIIDNGYATKREVIRYLNFFINQRKGMYQYTEACNKWQEDLNYVEFFK